jgi:hypothetical protein
MHMLMSEEMEKVNGVPVDSIVPYTEAENSGLFRKF